MDDYLSKAAAFGNGIRILNQDLWEMIITFIISQQKTIPAIRALVEALSERYGTRYKIPSECNFRTHTAILPNVQFSDISAGQHASATFQKQLSTSAAPAITDPSSGYYYAFPSPEELNRASLDDLLALKLGYRAKYIKRTCEDICSGKLDLDRLRGMNYGLHGSSSFLLWNRRQGRQLHLPLRPSPYRRFPGGHLDQKDPAARVRPEKPLYRTCPGNAALRGADRGELLEISGICRCAAAVYLLL